jgi:DNA (cytosine-5)-methyltransferase 1
MRLGKMTLGSLFDGMGGFPLAAERCGIRTLWASEIDPVCAGVAKRHFPDAAHVGDITRLDGAKLFMVDIITFGSPCQDLSIAGCRAGLAGERSGLFSEAVRVIKEMRNASKGKHPTFAVWENVPGALSSKGGEDFRVVLEELCRVADGSVSVPRPPRGKWTSAGEILGDKFSLAWRVLDARFWGVPQRRRRIFLVVDFGGGHAGEILFESEGLPRDIAPGGEAGESPAAGAGRGASRASVASRVMGFSYKASSRAGGIGFADETAPTLLGGGHHDAAVMYPCVGGFNGWKSVSGSIQYAEECAPTIEAAMPPNVLYPRVARTLTARGDGSPCADKGPNIAVVERSGESGCLTPWDTQNARIFDPDGISPTLSGADGGGGRNPAGLVMVENPRIAGTLCASGAGLNRPAGQGNETDLCAVMGESSFGGYKEGRVSALKASGGALGGGSENLIATGRRIVRRFTPRECERLMGLMPDDYTRYTDTGRELADTPRYRMLGNGVAIPCAEYVMRGIAAVDNERRETNAI